MYDFLNKVGFKLVRIEDNNQYVHHNLGSIFVTNVTNVKKANDMIGIFKRKGILTAYANYVKNVGEEYLFIEKAITFTKNYVEEMRINKLKRILK